MATEGVLVTQQRENGSLLLTVVGDVLIVNAAGLQRHLDEAIESDAERVTLDMSGVGYIDSFGVGVVVKTQSEIDKRHKRFKVLVNEALSRIFQKSHLDAYIDISIKDQSADEEE